MGPDPHDWDSNRRGSTQSEAEKADGVKIHGMQQPPTRMALGKGGSFPTEITRKPGLCVHAGNAEKSRLALVFHQTQLFSKVESKVEQ